MDEMLKRLYSTDDSMTWAEEFCKVFKGIYNTEIDEDWVFGWFANAMQTAAQIREEKIVRTRECKDLNLKKKQYKSWGI